MTRETASGSTKRLLSIPGQSRSEEQSMAMIVALTSEVTVLRARLDAFERLAQASGVVTQAAIDGFVPNAGADAERAALRARTLRRVFRSMREAAAEDLIAANAE